MEVVATDTMFYFADPKNPSASALRFVSPCYLYKQTAQGRETYYFYHKDFGAVGYAEYEGGRLSRTYILTDFRPGGSYVPW
jgi:hypothetical protein